LIKVKKNRSFLLEFKKEGFGYRDIIEMFENQDDLVEWANESGFQDEDGEMWSTRKTKHRMKQLVNKIKLDTPLVREEQQELDVRNINLELDKIGSEINPLKGITPVLLSKLESSVDIEV